jgi:hypothetical protein
MIVAAEALEHGTEGAHAEAGAGMERALGELGINRFVLAVTQRIVAPLAAAQGWGDPVGWLTEALATFEERRLPAPVRACRSALRDLGALPPEPLEPGPGLTKLELDPG